MAFKRITTFKLPYTNRSTFKELNCVHCFEKFRARTRKRHGKCISVPLGMFTRIRTKTLDMIIHNFRVSLMLIGHKGFQIIGQDEIKKKSCVGCGTRYYFDVSCADRLFLIVSYSHRHTSISDVITAFSNLKIIMYTHQKKFCTS